MQMSSKEKENVTAESVSTSDGPGNMLPGKS